MLKNRRSLNNGKQQYLSHTLKDERGPYSTKNFIEQVEYTKSAHE